MTILKVVYMSDEDIRTLRFPDKSVNDVVLSDEENLDLSELDPGAIVVNPTRMIAVYEAEE